MIGKLAASILAGLVAASALGAAATPAAAQNDGIYLNFGGRHDQRFGIYMGDGGHERDWRPRRNWRRDRGDGGGAWQRDWRRGNDLMDRGGRDRRNWWRGQGGGRSRFWQDN